MLKPLPIEERKKRDEAFENGLHWCSKCKTFKPVDRFSKCKNFTYGLYYWCKSCHSKLRKQDPNVKRKAKKRARQLVKYYVDLAGGCCQKCGYNSYYAAIDFHHINRHEKEYNLASLIVSNDHDLIISEINKCILLCSNCHRELESGCWSAAFIRRNPNGYTIKTGSLKINNVEYENLHIKYKYTQLNLM